MDEEAERAPVIRPRIAPDDPLSVIRFVDGGRRTVETIDVSWEAAANGRRARGPIRGSAPRLKIQSLFRIPDPVVQRTESSENRVSPIREKDIYIYIDLNLEKSGKL